MLNGPSTLNIHHSTFHPCPGGGMADAADLKSAAAKAACRFESGPGHHALSFAPAMTTATIDVAPGSPLTILSEEEQMFQQSVREFAIERIRPLVHDMDHDAKMSKDLIDSFF